MQKQRERMEARRKRLKEAAKKAAESKTKKPAPKADSSQLRAMSKSSNNYGASGTSKPKPIKKKPVNKVPSKTTKAASPSSAGRDRFFAGAKGGKYDKAVQNNEKAMSNFFRSSSGTRGKPLPPNPKLKSQSKKNLTGRQKIALEVAAASGGKSSAKRSASRKPANPKKDETYVTRTGMTMVWTGKNWKQKTK